MRTISLAEDAYEALWAMKKPGESFSDIVRRITRQRSLTQLADVMDEDSAAEVAGGIEANRKARRRRREED